MVLVIHARSTGSLKYFDLLLNEATQHARVRELVDIDDGGLLTDTVRAPHPRQYALRRC
jgi:hypothetical protein